MSIYYLLKVAEIFEKKLAQHITKHPKCRLPNGREGEENLGWCLPINVRPPLPLNPRQCADGYSLVIGTKARGRVRLQSSKSTQIPTGAQLTSPHGRVFRVLRGSTYANNAAIEIEAQETGSIDNERQGSVFTWMTTPIESASTAVAVANFMGGTNNRCE